MTGSSVRTYPSSAGGTYNNLSNAGAAGIIPFNAVAHLSNAIDLTESLADGGRALLVCSN